MMPRGTVDGMPCGNLVCVFCTVMIVDDDDDNKVRTIHDKLLTTMTVIVVLLRYLEIIED